MKYKATLLMLFLFSIQHYSQDYLNIKHSTSPTYKYSLLSELTEITFTAGGTEMTVTKTDASTSTADLSTVVEMTFDVSILGGGEPLPVELVSYTAEQNENGVKLFWTTATEVNNYGFEVQRQRQETSTKNQDKNWEALGFVEGHGNSNSLKEYSFHDLSPLGKEASYRLKQIDIDGDYEYSETITIELSKPTKYNIQQNYPNPFNPSTVITYSIPKSGKVALRVYSILGEEVATLVNENKEAGSYEVVFNGSELSSGVYVCTMSNPNYSSSIKMLIMK